MKENTKIRKIWNEILSEKKDPQKEIKNKENRG